MPVALVAPDDKTVAKAERKCLQIEHTPHLSERGKLVRLAEKICNVRAVHPGLEVAFDKAFQKK